VHRAAVVHHEKHNDIAVPPKRPAEALPRWAASLGFFEPVTHQVMACEA
jgi:hypothetical protein